MAKRHVYQWDKSREDGDGGEVSRSQRKRDSTAQQELGQRLAELPVSRLGSMDLPEDLVAAVKAWHSMPTREAKRRQMQFVGRVMRDVDMDAVAAEIDRITAPHRADTTALHKVEQLRDELLAAGPDHCAALIAAWPEQAAQLTHLVREAVAEKSAGRPPKAYRSLFKLLRELMTPEGDA